LISTILKWFSVTLNYCSVIPGQIENQEGISIQSSFAKLVTLTHLIHFHGHYQKENLALLFSVAD